MQQYSHILSKPIVSLYDCTKHGTATNLFVSKKWKCEYISLSHLGLDYIINTRDILNHTLDCITIKNNSIINLQDCMTLELSNYYNIIDNPTYSVSGKYLGRVQDISLTPQYYVDSITLDSGQIIPQNMLFNISNDLVITKDKPTKLDRYKYKPKGVPKKNSIIQNTPVNTLSNLSTTTQPKSNTLPISTTPNPTKPITKPDSSLLLKRVATKTILTANGEIIVRANSKISQDIVKKARYSGKLFELIKFSK